MSLVYRRIFPLLLAVGSAGLTGCFGSEEKTAPQAASDRIRIAMLQPPRAGLTPLSDDAFKLSRWSTSETLIVLDENGDAQPALAMAWQPVDDTSWRFTLRPDVRFHDGEPLTPAAVVNALTAATQAAPKPRILDGVTLHIRADGDNAVRVTTATPDPLLPQRLSSPQLAILSPNAYQQGRVDPIRHGSGPFVLTAVQGTSHATLERLDGP
ncbi:hypothetical protein J5224_32465 [Candidatus Symbiopectobacterium sp. NZEC135]|nr:hypothetical protein [Candidatus Symbiopectobacterium sp. NZEC135]